MMQIKIIYFFIILDFKKKEEIAWKLAEMIEYHDTINILHNLDCWIFQAVTNPLPEYDTQQDKLYASSAM